METIKTQNQDTVVAVDLGSTKVYSVIARKNILGRIEIIGYGKSSNEGVIRGVVSNIDKTAKAISDAIDMAEKTSRQEISAIHTGIAGQHIKTMSHQAMSYRNNPQDEISQEELDKLNLEMVKVALPLGEQILHVLPQEYTIDDQTNIMDPIGMCGSKLQCNYQIISGQTAATNNINRSFEKAGLQIESIRLNSLSSAESVLSHEEKEAGVVLIDMGGGTTDISIYQEGILRYTSSIPIGSAIITKDIKAGCTVTHDQAEKLKVRFGSALAEEVIDNRIITIPGIMGREPKEISEKNLARIIQARVQEIFDFIMFEIHKSGFENRLVAGIVLTGGGANLKNIDLLAEYQTGLPSRIGDPISFGNSAFDKEVLLPEYSVCLGIIKEAMKHVTVVEQKSNSAKAVFDLVEAMDEKIPEPEMQKERNAKPSWFGTAINKGYRSMKEFFEASPDSEF